MKSILSLINSLALCCSVFYKYGTLPLKKRRTPLFQWEYLCRFGVMLPAGREISFADMFTGISRKICPQDRQNSFWRFLKPRRTRRVPRKNCEKVLRLWGLPHPPNPLLLRRRRGLFVECGNFSLSRGTMLSFSSGALAERRISGASMSHRCSMEKNIL